MPTPAVPSRTVVRATLLGGGVAALPVAAVWASGVGGAHGAMLWLGLGAALLAAALGALAQRGVVRQQGGGDARLTAARLQTWLGLSFGAKLLVLCLVAGGLYLAGLKFEAIATFALTFVGAALLCQLTAAGLLVRALGRAQADRNQP